MVFFGRFNFFGKPLILCATTTLLWTKLNNDNEEKLKSAIAQADLICQAFKEKQGIPGTDRKIKHN